MSSSNEEIIRVEHIFKSFGPTKALVDVSFAVNHGDIRGLIGENGSGKSTVSSIIAGVQPADNGEMFLHGKPYKPHDMVDAQNHKISMIVQEKGTIDGIGVADNIFIGKERRFTKMGIVDHRRMCEEAGKILKKIGSDIDPHARIDELNAEDRKIVEIARGLYDEPELFIVDETTTALSQKGRDMVYSIMRGLQAQGKAVLFISHDLDELMEVCNAITVLRDGVLIDTLTREEMNVDRLRSLMVGRELTGDYYRSDYDGSYDEEVVLECEQITSGPVLENFSLQLHKGEILGLGGLSDCGMREVGRVLFGIDPHITGKVILHKDGKDIEITNDPKVCIDNKMGYVSKNRDVEAIILNASIRDNVVLPSLNLLRDKNPAKLITKKAERKLAEQCIDSMSIKCQGPKQYVSDLSGGNKQKVVFAKWIGNGSDILILDCPTRGIDVGVKASMYQLMAEYKKQGKSMIMISEELPELIGMSDRILILKDGKQTAEFMRSPDLKDSDIISAMI